MARTLHFIFVCYSIVLAVLCNRPSNTCRYITPPPTLIVQLLRAGIPLPDSILGATRLVYEQGGTEKNITDLNLGTPDFRNKGMMGTQMIGILSADNNIKNYYLRYPGVSKPDTLFVNYLPHTPQTNCLYVLSQVRFNNQELTPDTSFHFSTPVYILNK
ncbi:MAG TPA: hypothetical protein VLD19_10020 [Chitinophagaceae bacterium]|nr:hypothetical protein [Chitinophagaceae bacterium]